MSRRCVSFMHCIVYFILRNSVRVCRAVVLGMWQQAAGVYNCCSLSSCLGCDVSVASMLYRTGCTVESFCVAYWSVALRTAVAVSLVSLWLYCML
jgi:hypothetical protein